MIGALIKAGQYVLSAATGISLAVGVNEVVDKLNDRTNEDKNTIPWPSKKRGKWSCICKAEKAGRRASNCSKNDKDRAYGWGIDNVRSTARKQAENMAVELLGAGSVHHVSCKCTGPKGERWNRGG